MCICTGPCPGFASLNLWELINNVRGELDVEYVIVHPRFPTIDYDKCAGFMECFNFYCNGMFEWDQEKN